jgi:hypothetical protein
MLKNQHTKKKRKKRKEKGKKSSRSASELHCSLFFKRTVQFPYTVHMNSVYMYIVHVCCTIH